jgi:hypothetical protein
MFLIRQHIYTSSILKLGASCVLPGCWLVTEEKVFQSDSLLSVISTSKVQILIALNSPDMPE